MEAVRRRAKKRPFVTFFGVALSLIVLCILVGDILVPPYGVMLKAAKRAKTSNEVIQVQTALLSYYTEYAVYPVATDNASLIKMLTGATSDGNVRRIQFLTLKPSDQNASGAILDPWGTPIEMKLGQDGVFTIRSAGPDRVFGNADDITATVDESTSVGK